MIVILTPRALWYSSTYPADILNAKMPMAAQPPSHEMHLNIKPIDLKINE
jgi:hypothetical protein